MSLSNPRTSRPKALPIALLAACLVVLAAVTSGSFWIDEGGSVFKAMQPTLTDWWQAMRWERNSNMQLPLYLVVLWGWQKVFGSGEMAIRLANGPFFLLTIWGLWVAFRAQAARFAFAVLFLLTNAFAWFYLNEARPYTLLLAGSTLLFAAVYRLKEEPDGLGQQWAWVFTAAALLVCATSMIAVPWAACAFCAAWHVRGRNFPLEFVRRFPLAFACLALGMAGLGGYYVWSLKSGADVPSMGKTGWLNLGFVAYELFGFAGLGPGRNVMRVEFLQAFKGFYGPLAVYGTLWTAALAWVIWLRARLASRRTIVFYLILLVPIVLVMLAGYGHGVRILPRYLTPALPLVIGLGSYLAAQLWPRGAVARCLVAGLCLVALASALEIRLAPRHAKDDYRSAVNAAKKAAAQGTTVFWAADVQTAVCYGLIQQKQIDSGSQEVVLYSTPGAQQELPSSALVVLSKVDIYDPAGAIREFLRRNGYTLTDVFQSFQLWRRPGTAPAALPAR